MHLQSPGLTRGAVKPPYPAIIDWKHPFVQGMQFMVPFDDQGSRIVKLAIGQGTAPRILTAGRYDSSILGSRYIDAATTVAWSSNRQGPSMVFPSGRYAIGLGKDVEPDATAGVTVLVVRRKLDTTNRVSALFGAYDILDHGGTGYATLMRAMVPYSDGTVYWQYGDNAGANSLTAAGLTFSTSIPERWVFTAGPRGSAIWQNGVKVASQATALTRNLTSTGARFSLNYRDDFVSGGDNEEFNFFQINNLQWTDDLCAWWSAEPYAHLYPHQPILAALIPTPSSFTVTKVTVPSGVSQLFTIVGTGGFSPASFQLGDGDSQVFFLTPGVYSLYEVPVSGYTATYDVSNGDPIGAITVVSGVSVTVTITNRTVPPVPPSTQSWRIHRCDSKPRSEQKA